MKLTKPLFSGKLIKRYKRFLADIELDSGEVITAHCANTGGMTGCNIPGSTVLLSYHDNPKRKLKFSWELVKLNKHWVCINTALPNKLVFEAIQQGKIPTLLGYPQIKTEVKYAQNSRVDLLLSDEEKKCYVEVKNVTLAEGDLALFPDAVTIRGQKHLRDLMQMVDEGHRAVIFFVINRGDVKSFSPADKIDPVYGELLRKAIVHGVEVLAYQTKIDPPEIKIGQKLTVFLDDVI